MEGVKNVLAIFGENQYLLLSVIVAIPLVPLIRYFTERFGLSYFSWIGILCIVAGILGLIGHFLFDQSYKYAGVTATILCALSFLIGHMYFELRGSETRVINFLLVFGISAGVFVILYSWLFFGS